MSRNPFGLLEPQAKCLAGCVLRKVFYIWFPIRTRHLIDCPNLLSEVGEAFLAASLFYPRIPLKSGISREGTQTHEIPTFVGVDGKGFVLGVSPLQLASPLSFRVLTCVSPGMTKGMHGEGEQSNSPACDLPLDIYAKIVKAGATYIDGPKWPLKCRINHYGQLY